MSMWQHSRWWHEQLRECSRVNRISISRSNCQQRLVSKKGEILRKRKREILQELTNRVLGHRYNPIIVGFNFDTAVTEKIYIETEEGPLNALEETPFSREDELQSLIASHPELIDGEQIRPGDPRRWVLIKREKGIAETTGEAARWAVDTLLVDQDAVPTLVEVKRGTNPEVRRTVIGQLLEYATHASTTWSAEELRQAFERNVASRRGDPLDELSALLGPEREQNIEEFWEDLSTNLAAKRLRLLFVADSIPDSLARVAEFLNAEMTNIEVLAVEIKRFNGGIRQILVPRVIGREAASPKHERTKSSITRESFLNEFSDENARQVAERLLNVAEKEGCVIYYGQVGLSIRVRCALRQAPVSVAWLYPPERTGWMNTHAFSFGVSVLREKNLADPLRTVLESWTAVFASDDLATKVPAEGVEAWTINHQSAVGCQDVLEDRLRSVVQEIAAL